MKKMIRLCMVLTLVLLAGCSGLDTHAVQNSGDVKTEGGIESIRTADGPVAISGRGGPQTYVYECSDGYGFTARTEEGRAWLFLPSQTVSLPLLHSGSDATYSDGSITFQLKGDKSSLEIGEKSHADCANNRAKAIW